MSFGGGAPKTPEPPKPPPPKPVEKTAEPVKKAVSERARKIATSKGRESTLITVGTGNKEKKKIIGIK